MKCVVCIVELELVAAVRWLLWIEQESQSYRNLWLYTVYGRPCGVPLELHHDSMYECKSASRVYPLVKRSSQTHNVHRKYNYLLWLADFESYHEGYRNGGFKVYT